MSSAFLGKWRNKCDWKIFGPLPLSISENSAKEKRGLVQQGSKTHQTLVRRSTSRFIGWYFLHHLATMDSSHLEGRNKFEHRNKFHNRCLCICLGLFLQHGRHFSCHKIFSFIFHIFIYIYIHYLYIFSCGLG